MAAAEAMDTKAANTRAGLHSFAAQALASYSAGDPCADHLISLIHLNFVNSFTANASALRLDVEWLICNSISPIGFVGPAYNPSNASVPMPPSLSPTPLQSRMPHHPWIDLFPFPSIRDNFLLATSSNLSEDDEIQLWNDVVESESPGGDWTGFIVWGVPWMPDSWEVTVPFLRRWGWLLHGCPQIIESTNHWRRIRGERPVKI